MSDTEVIPSMAPDERINNNVGEAEGIPSISLLGVRVHKVDMDSTLDRVRQYIKSEQPHIIVTADSSGIVIAQRDEDYKNLVNSADLVTPDSFGVLWGAKLMGTPLISRVSGIDIAYKICKMASTEGFSIFLLGAKPGIAVEAAERLKSDFPGLQIAGTHHGYFDKSEEVEVVNQIRESGAKVLFVAMGIPVQEKWIRDHLSELGVSVAMGVGGSLDVLSGRVKRAPLWMQKHGLEWAYRLKQNPRKISKVASLPRFLALVLKDKLTK